MGEGGRGEGSCGSSGGGSRGSGEGGGVPRAPREGGSGGGRGGRRERVVVEMAKRGWTNETEALRANAAEAKRAAAVAARRADDVKKTFAAGGWRIGDRVIAQPNNQSAGRVSNRGAEILRGDVGTVIGPSRGKKAPPGFIVVEFDGKGRIDMDGTAHLSTEAGLLWCTACHRRLPKGGFSASQLDNGRKGGERRCSACVHRLRPRVGGAVRQSRRRLACRPR